MRHQRTRFIFAGEPLFWGGLLVVKYRSGVLVGIVRWECMDEQDVIRIY